MEITATEIAFLALLLFIGLLVYLKVPQQIAGALDQKSQAIAHELHEARRLREEAEKLHAEYEAKRAAAESEAKAIIEAAKAQAALVAEETRQSMMAAMRSSSPISVLCTHERPDASGAGRGRRARDAEQVRLKLITRAARAAGGEFGTQSGGAFGVALLFEQTREADNAAFVQRRAV